MQSRDARNWVSKTLEGAFNTGESTGSNYSYLGTQTPYWWLPKLSKRNDGNRAGKSAPTHLCNEYWEPMNMPVGDDVETDNPARLFRRALGGSVTNTTVATGVYDHTFAILNPQVGQILPSFSMAHLLGTASFLAHGCMVDSFKVSQKMAERAQYEAMIVNSGKFTNPHGLSSLPEFVSPPCMDGWRTTVTYVDSASELVDLGDIGTIIEWSVEHKNNIKTAKRRIGDTAQTAGGGEGAHVRKLPRGRYETLISLLVDFVDTGDWGLSLGNLVCTNLKFTMKGPIFATVSSVDYRHEFEIIVPSFVFESVDTGEDDDDAATPINVLALEDPTSKGTITGRVRNNVATLV